jgi:hypothetical protein
MSSLVDELVRSCQIIGLANGLNAPVAVGTKSTFAS